MLYRKMGSTGLDVSILGFGCMRLPVLSDEAVKGTALVAGSIDTELATTMLHDAIDQGVNYVDTAWFYHSPNWGQGGESEPFVGEALSGGWRDKVYLATKLPQQLIKTADEMDSYLAQQLERLQTDHIDFYLVHGVTGASWARMRDLGVREFLDRAKADGRIRHAAFSFHGQAHEFAGIVDEYDWAFAQIQYNYMDLDYQAGLAGLRYAADKGVGVVVMEPIKGGKLATNLPSDVQAVFDSATVKRSPAEWALRYVWNEPGVSLALSGMSAPEQVAENIRIAADGVAGSLAPEEVALFTDARRLMAARIKADCTACGYCQPCPAGVEIPRVLAALNAATQWDDSNHWATGYSQIQGVASLCTECGQCEDICPQSLPIRDLMKDAVATFGR